MIQERLGWDMDRFSTVKNDLMAGGRIGYRRRLVPQGRGEAVIRALLTGVLYGAPEARTARSGKAFVTGKLRADDGKGGACSVHWWRSMSRPTAGAASRRRGAVRERQGRGASVDFQGRRAARPGYRWWWMSYQR